MMTLDARDKTKLMKVKPFIQLIHMKHYTKLLIPLASREQIEITCHIHGLLPELYIKTWLRCTQ